MQKFDSPKYIIFKNAGYREIIKLSAFQIKCVSETEFKLRHLQLIAPRKLFATDRNPSPRSFGNRASLFLYGNCGHEISPSFFALFNNKYTKVQHTPIAVAAVAHIHLKRYVMLLACFAVRITSYQSNSRARRSFSHREAAPSATRVQPKTLRSDLTIPICIPVYAIDYFFFPRRNNFRIYSFEA